MSNLSDDFFEKMLLFFPFLLDEYENHIKKYGNRLETIIIEDIFMPEVVELLKKERDENLLQDIFLYFETLVDSSDKDFLNIFSITAMEILGNDKEILDKAKKYMGVKTAQLQLEADRELGRKRES